MYSLKSRLILTVFMLIASLSFNACDDESDPARFDVLVTVDQNEGNAPATFTFSAQNNGPLDGDYTYQWRFGDGEESDEASPSHIYDQAGEYEVTLDLSERGGGSGQGSVSVQVRPPVNLAVNTLSFTPMNTLAPGQEASASWRFSQSASAVAPWQFGLYLVSSDGEVPNLEATPEGLSQDGVYEVAVIQPIEMGETGDGARDESFESSFIIPDDLTSGDYYLAVVADREGVVGETDRQDNVAISAVALRIRSTLDSGPDLSLCALTVTSFTGVEAGQSPIVPLGDQLEVQLCISNLGDRPLVDTPYAVYLSADATLDEGDLLLAQGVEQAIGPNDRVETSLLLDIPIDTPVGAYRLLGVADPEDQVIERSEDNNHRASPVSFELVEPGEVEGVDLVVTSLSVDRSQVFWGQALSGTIAITHRGDVDISRLFVVRFNGLPVDAGIPPQQLPSLNVPGITAGETLELPFELSISPRIPEGRYRLQVEVDPTNSTNDVNPGNNRRATPDILDIGGEPSFDPAARALTLSQTEIEAGQSLNTTLTIVNLGDDATGNFKVALLISDDERLGNDLELDLVDIESLEGGEEREIEISLPIPRTLDQAVTSWRVGAFIDPQRLLSGELTDENNWIFAEEELTVTGATGGCAEDSYEENDDASRAISLDAGEYQELGACDDADWFSVNVPSGQVLTVRASLAGELEEAGSFPTLDLGEGSGAVIRTAERRGDELVLVIPARDQLSRPYLRITGGGAPINYNLSVSLDEPASLPNLGLSEVSVQPGVAGAGSFVEVSVTLTNMGGATVSEGTLNAALVVSPTAEAQEIGALMNVEAWSTPSISAGASVRLEARLSLPAEVSDGLYQLRLLHSSYDSENQPLAWAVASLRIDEVQSCDADRFEPNGSPHEPDGVTLGASEVGSGTFPELFACVGDDDWYRITLDEGDALNAEITFDRLRGDLDLELYEADGQTLIAESSSLRGEESVTIFRSVTSADYLLRVFLKPSDEVNLATEYQLNIDVGPSQTCGDDGFEPNASAEEAALLPDGIHDLVVCPGGEDWFRFQIPAGNIVSYQVTTGFDNVEMSLFDPDDNLIESNNRRIAHEALFTGSYRLRVSPTNQEQPAQYTIVVSGVSGLDLAVSDIRLTSPSGGAGAELYADVTLESRRGDSAQNVLVRFTLSEDLRVSRDDVTLGEQRVAEIEGASSRDLRQRMTIPEGLTPGLYSVICEVDPLLELDDFLLGNNITRAPFTVNNACIDDDERENEGPRTATELSWDQEDASQGGVICELTEDWYVITAPAGQRTFTLDTPEGDLDLSVYRVSDQSLLDISATESSPEEVTVDFNLETEIYLRVDGFFNERGSYTLTWR
jgi:hypothetical protein